jgi:DNA segregation ATPase FtsK/SpoIIIE, S-DNA-T family
LFCFGLAILFAASIWVRMPNGVGQWIFGLAGSVVGDGAFAIPALFALLGRWFIRNPDRNFGDSPAGIGWAAVLAGALGLLHIANGLPTLSRATGGWPAVRAAGGVVGMLASWPLDKGLTPWGAIPALALLACYGILVLTGTPVREVPQRLRELKVLFGLQVDDEWEPEDTDEVDGADVLRRGELGRGAIRLNGAIDPSDR